MRKGKGDRSGERFLCFFGNKSLPAPIYLFLSLVSSLESDPLRYPSVLWLTDAVTSGDMPLFRKGVGVWKGGNVGSLRHVVHMSSGNGKYCVGNVARRISNFATFIVLLQASLSLFLSLIRRFGGWHIHIIISNHRHESGQNFKNTVIFLNIII